MNGLMFKNSWIAKRNRVAEVHTMDTTLVCNESIDVSTMWQNFWTSNMFTACSYSKEAIIRRRLRK
jgi:hypothetical protein